MRPWYDAAGDVGGIVIFSEDITERHQLLKEIESVARFPDENPYPILRISGDGELIYANRSSATLLKSPGWKPGEALTGDWRQYALQTLGSGCCKEMELTCDEVVYSLILVPVSDLGYLNIYGRDITGKKQAEFRLTSDLDALTRMHALSGRLLETGGMQSLLQEAMDAAVFIVGAEKGTLQLLEGDSLRIVANHGHRQPFLEFFESAENKASVCGEATRCGERVVVPDVETSPLFIGTPSLEVLRKAGVRAGPHAHDEPQWYAAGHTHNAMGGPLYSR